MQRFSDNTLKILKKAGWYPGRHVPTDEFEAYVKQEFDDAYEGETIDFDLVPNDTIRSFLHEFGGLTLTMHRTIPWVQPNSFKEATTKIPIGIPGTRISVFVEKLEVWIGGDKLYPFSNDDDMLWYSMSYSGKVYGSCCGRFTEMGKSADAWIERTCDCFSGLPSTPSILIHQKEPDTTILRLIENNTQNDL